MAIAGINAKEAVHWTAPTATRLLQAQGNKMDHLSGSDAAFLHLESPETPMHVGGLAILELPADYAGDFMEDVRTHIQNRMHMAPIFQRKLINMPFDIANPICCLLYTSDAADE